ncbi:hypothetical protein QF205_07050 [Luteimonas composti]|uniref:Uncharacterized protein n=1 Tax=Luteimonas composti TaxID=398257 RepID=A0ABT6MQC9_9GAMM|nr:hypothetical protein [Luteimonas composti]MDH7452839.1 hypothetical protein [Luteimonas composti]
MAFPYKSLQDAGVDVAAAVHENFLNNFSKGHFKSVPNLYKGGVDFNEFESRVTVGYKIQEALTFNLKQIPQSKIKNVLLSHYKDAKKSTNAETYLDAFAPPNVELTGKKVEVTITVFKGHTNDVDFSIGFNWSIDARCLIYFKEYSSEKKAIRLEAIRVAFSKSEPELLKEIVGKLKRVLPQPVESTGKTSTVSASTHNHKKDKKGTASAISSNDEWCTKLEKLFLFLVNQVLAIQFTNFVNEWELPRAIEISDGASISPSLLSVDDNYLIVGAQVNYIPSQAVTEIHTAVASLLDEFNDQYRQEFSGMTDDDFYGWKPEKSQSLNWLKSREVEAQKKAAGSGQKLAKKAFDKNLLLLANDRLFDAVAKSELKASGSSSYGKKLDHLVKAEAGWWYTVGPASASVIKGGIQVEAAAEVGGYVRGCVPDLDPKNWGDWRCEGICIKLGLKDFGIQARPSFDNDGVYFRFSLKSGSAITFGFCDAPGWLNDLLGWISALFTRALLSVISTLVSLFKFKIVDYPEHFPGTGLEWKPRLNQKPENQLTFLEFSGDPSFT